MISDLEEYIEAHISEEPFFLKQIDRETNLRLINGRMCSGHIQGRLLKMLVRMINPEKILELGTFTGYSALSMAEGMRESGTIDTIEADDELEDVIRENLGKSPHGKKVRLHIGDAMEVMHKWSSEEFDLILIDADKRQYPEYFKRAKKLVKKGGYIIADNTLWDGHVTESGKHSSQTSGIIRFNDIVAQDKELEVAIIPIRDGITLIRKVPERENEA